MLSALTCGDAGQWHPRTENDAGFVCHGPVLQVRASVTVRTILIANPYQWLHHHGCGAKRGVMDVTLSQYRVFYKSLAIKIACAIIIVSVIPLIIMAALSRYFFVESYRIKVLDHLTSVALMQQREVEGFFSDRLNALRLIGTATPFEMLDSETSLQGRLAELQRVYGQSILGLAFCNTRNDLKSCVDTLGWKIGDYLESLKLEKVSASGAHVWEAYYPASGTHRVILAVSVEQSEQKGILLAIVSIEALTAAVERLQSKQVGTALILRNTGEPLTTGDSALKGIQCDMTVADEPDRPDMIVRESRDGSALCIRATLKNSDWAIQLVADKEKAYEAYSQPRLFAISTLLMGILGIVAVAVVVSNRFSKYVAHIDQEKQLLNEQLVQAGKLASLGQMAANMGHEINNPVGIIVQEAQWIKALAQKGETALAGNMTAIQDSLDEIQSHGKRCRDIILKLVSFARHDQPDVQPVQLNELIREVLSLCERRAQSMNVELRLNLSPELPMAKAAPSDAEQVVINLLNNSLDAMEQSSGIIEVRTSTKGRYVIVEIKDSGPGISRENLGRIFEPFFTTKPEGQGTGLGLSICYAMMKKMKGDITVRSEEGKGTIFHLFFPL